MNRKIPVIFCDTEWTLLKFKDKLYKTFDQSLIGLLDIGQEGEPEGKCSRYVKTGMDLWV